MKDLEGKVALVTGGTSGIGLALAKELIAAGAKVVIGYRRNENFEAALRDFGVQDRSIPFGVKLDVMNRDDWKSSIDYCRSEVGDVDILCNVAGVAVAGPPDLATFDDWDWILQTNLGGTINGIQSVLSSMIARRTGHIMNMSSIFGLTAAKGAAPYITSKFAVVGLSEALSADLAEHSIEVSVCCPGYVRSNLTSCLERRPQTFKKTGYTSQVIEQFRLAMPPSTPNDWMDAADVAADIVCGIREGKMHILTHSYLRPYLEARNRALASAWPQDSVDEDQTLRFSARFGNAQYNT